MAYTVIDYINPCAQLIRNLSTGMVGKTEMAGAAFQVRNQSPEEVSLRPDY